MKGTQKANTSYELRNAYKLEILKNKCHNYNSKGKFGTRILNKVCI